jgi:hypothetical protein
MPLADAPSTHRHTSRQPCCSAARRALVRNQCLPPHPPPPLCRSSSTGVICGRGEGAVSIVWLRTTAFQRRQRRCSCQRGGSCCCSGVMIIRRAAGAPAPSLPTMIALALRPSTPRGSWPRSACTCAAAAAAAAARPVHGDGHFTAAGSGGGGGGGGAQALHDPCVCVHACVGLRLSDLDHPRFLRFFQLLRRAIALQISDYLATTSSQMGGTARDAMLSHITGRSTRSSAQRGLPF